MPASRRRVDLAATVWRSWALLCPDSHPSVPNPRSNSGSHYTPDHARVGELAKPPRLGSRQCDAWKRSDEMQATASEPPCPHRVRDLLTVTEPGLNGPSEWQPVSPLARCLRHGCRRRRTPRRFRRRRRRSRAAGSIDLRAGHRLPTVRRGGSASAFAAGNIFSAHRSQQHLKSWISCRQASAR